MKKATKEGWCTKEGGFIKTWKKRWFSLVGQTLFYSKNPGDTPQGKITLKDATDISLAPSCKKQPAFKIDVTGARTYYIVAESKAEAESWVATLKEARDGTETPKVCIDDFEIIRVIGRGTYGKVQLVRYKGDGKLYAMKSLSKRLLAEYDQIEQTLTERNILLRTSHPFLVSAKFAFQTEAKIFLILDYVQGGELFSRLKEEGSFSESRTKLYAAEILLGLGHLHSIGLIYRDLKPENILIDVDGHLKLTDFGLAKDKMDGTQTTSTFCGTPEYISPEMLQKLPYNKAVDFWAFGILLYEMLTGLPPFYDDNSNKMYRAILQDQIRFPSKMSREVQDLISKLLDRNPMTRLGSGPADIKEIKSHPWFADLNWDDVMSKKIKPEWVPHISGATDTSCFDEEFTQETAAVSYEDGSLINSEVQESFNGFTCTDDSLI